MHLGCRSGAAAEGWSSRIGRGVGRVFGCSSVNSWGERERGGYGCFYPHLYMKLHGLWSAIPVTSSLVLVSSYQRRRRLLSRLPHLESAGLSVRLSSLCCCRVFKGWALSLCLFLLRLSLLMTPPFVPTPHLSVSQELRSPAEEPERPATRPSPAAGMRAGSLESRSCRSGDNPRRPHLSMPCCSG